MIIGQHSIISIMPGIPIPDHRSISELRISESTRGLFTAQQSSNPGNPGNPGNPSNPAI